MTSSSRPSTPAAVFALLPSRWHCLFLISASLTYLTETSDWPELQAGWTISPVRSTSCWASSGHTVTCVTCADWAAFSSRFSSAGEEEVSSQDIAIISLHWSSIAAVADWSVSKNRLLLRFCSGYCLINICSRGQCGNPAYVWQSQLCEPGVPGPTFFCWLIWNVPGLLGYMFCSGCAQLCWPFLSLASDLVAVHFLPGFLDEI